MVNSKLNQALFFLSVATICTLFASCNKKDSCQECAEQRAEENASMNTATSEVILDSTTADYQTEETATASSSTERTTGSGRTKTTTKKANESDEDADVSIINPNDKSNSDSKRTYGSSGTGGGSGTSGSGGDGNGSSGWNADAKKDKN